jgi:hypothetical protein
VNQIYQYGDSTERELYENDWDKVTGVDKFMSITIDSLQVILAELDNSFAGNIITQGSMDTKRG